MFGIFSLFIFVDPDCQAANANFSFDELREKVQQDREIDSGTPSSRVIILTT